MTKPREKNKNNKFVYYLYRKKGTRLNSTNRRKKNTWFHKKTVNECIKEKEVHIYKIKGNDKYDKKVKMKQFKYRKD